MKVDDDVFVQTHRLQKFLYSVVGPGVQPLRNTFMCVVHRYPVVDRDPSHKWYVSRDQYGFDFFPTYCGGNSVCRRLDHFYLFLFIKALYNIKCFIYIKV